MLARPPSFTTRTIGNSPMKTPLAVIAVALVVASFGASASDWQPLVFSVAPDPVRLQIDRASLVDTRDGRLRMWVRLVYAKPHTYDGPPPQSFRSVRILLAIDCPFRRYGYEWTQYFADSDLERPVAQLHGSSSPYRPIEPDSIAEAVLEELCPAKTTSLWDYLDSLQPSIAPPSKHP